MKNKIQYIVTLISLMFTAAAVNLLPDSIPMHYGIDGKADRYGSSFELFIYPLIMLAFCLFFDLMRRFIRKSAEKNGSEKEIEKSRSNEKVLNICSVLIAVMELVMEIAAVKNVVYMMETGDDSMGGSTLTVLTAVMGAFFIIAGNYLPKTKPNSAIGLRTSWTMADPVVWQKSNRFGGAALMAGGVLTIIATAFTSGFVSTLIMLGIVIAVAIISTVYSYRVSNELQSGS